MNVYEKINNVFHSTDLLECAHHLQDFAESALKEKDRRRIVNDFYERVYMYAGAHFMNDSFSGSHCRYSINCDNSAVCKYLMLTLPKKDTPVKSLHNIQAFSNDLLLNFAEPVGNHISHDMVKKIMEYLDEKYSFADKVFPGHSADFLIFNNTHQDVDSQFAITDNGFATRHFFFLYANREISKYISPEAVLFHELGHAIHASFTGSLDIIPENIFLFLKELCFPDILDKPILEQQENFAHILSMGLMYDSPFAEFDHFDYIHPEDKKIFKKIVEFMLGNSIEI